MNFAASIVFAMSEKSANCVFCVISHIMNDPPPLLVPWMFVFLLGQPAELPDTNAFFPRHVLDFFLLCWMNYFFSMKIAPHIKWAVNQTMSRWESFYLRYDWYLNQLNWLLIVCVCVCVLGKLLPGGRAKGRGGGKTSGTWKPQCIADSALRK